MINSTVSIRISGLFKFQFLKTVLENCIWAPALLLTDEQHEPSSGEKAKQILFHVLWYKLEEVDDKTSKNFFYCTKNHKREKHCHCVIVYHFVSSYFTLKKLWNSFILSPPPKHMWLSHQSDFMCGILCMGCLAQVTF